MEYKAEQYAKDVIKGKIVAGEYIRLACERYFNDLKIAKEKGWVFNRKKAEAVIDYFTMLRHWKGSFAGQPVELLPWQQFIIWNVYGWHKSDGFRRFRYSYTEVAKKNGKTTMMAGCALWSIDLDGEAGPQSYIAATKSEQAMLCFNDCKNFVQKSPDINSVFETYQYSVYNPENNGSIKPLSKDTKSQDGIDLSCGIIDEYHAHKNDEMFDNLKSASVRRKQPLIHIITTAGFNLTGPCYEFRTMCIDVLKGIKTDDTLFPMIFSLDEGDDWNNKDVWIKANPSLGSGLDWESLEIEYNNAINQPSKQYNFRVKNLNQWVNKPTQWIEDETWMAIKQDYKANDLKGLECYGGLDLAAVRDLAAMSLNFDMPDGTIKTLQWYWLPEETAAKMYGEHGDNYRLWADQGFIKLTEGNAIDHRVIQKDIEAISQIYKIKLLGYDPYSSTETIVYLQDAGINCKGFGQNISSMSQPSKELEARIIDKKIFHNGNPVTRWMMNNCSTYTDPNENIKIKKATEKGKIDGIIAIVIGLGVKIDLELKNRKEKSVYTKEGRGLRTL